MALSFQDTQVLLHNLMCPDNHLRNEAEKMFDQLKQKSDMALLSLLQILPSTASDDLRSLAAVILRRVLIKDHVSLWIEASPATQTRLKQELVQCLLQEQNPSIRRKIGDTVGELASGILELGQWPELVPVMLNWLQATDVQQRDSALRVIELIAEYIASQLVSDSTFAATFHPILHALLKDPSIEVRVQALRATGMLLFQQDAVRCCEQAFHCSLQLIFQMLIELVEEGEVDDLQDSLEILIEIVDNFSALFRSQTSIWIELMLSICNRSGHELTDSCRQLGMEFIVCFVEKEALAFRHEYVGLIDPLFTHVFQMMLELEEGTPDALIAWGHEMHEEDEEEIINFDVSLEALDRLALALGNQTVLPVCGPLLERFLQHEVEVVNAAEWKVVYCGLMGLSQIVEVLPFELPNSESVESFTQIVSKVFSLAHHFHPKIQYAALNAIGQMASDHAPLFQYCFYQQTVELITAFLHPRDSDTSILPRVQLHACSALLNFLLGCLEEEEDIPEHPKAAAKEAHETDGDEIDDEMLEFRCHTDMLSHHASGLLTCLMQLITKEGSHSSIKQQALSCVCSLYNYLNQRLNLLTDVNDLPKLHQMYYYPYLPIVQSLLPSDLTLIVQTCHEDAAQAKGYGKVIECLSLIGTGLGKDAFAAQAQELMTYCLRLYDQVMPTRSDTHTNIDDLYLVVMQTFGQLCTCLSEDFEPYLERAMAILVPSASQVAETVLENEHDADEVSDEEDQEIVVRSTSSQHQQQRIAVQSSKLEEKRIAWHVIGILVHELPAPCVGFVEQLTKLVMPIITDSIDCSLRTTCITLVPDLVQALVVHEGASTPPSRQEPKASIQLLVYVIGQFVNVMQVESDLQLLLTLLQSIQLCVQMAAKAGAEALSSVPVLTKAQLIQLFKALMSILGESMERRGVLRQQHPHQGQMNEDDEEEVQQHIANEQALHFLVAECIGSLIQTHPTLGLACAIESKLLDLVIEMSAPDCFVHDREFAVFVLDDLLEYAIPNAVETMQTNLQQLVAMILPVLHRELDLQMIASCNSSLALIQAAAYGIGIAASTIPAACFERNAKDALAQLQGYISHALAQNDRSNAVDNAISAYGLLLEHQHMHFGAPEHVCELFLQWLEYLPLQSDWEESKHVMHRLSRLINHPQHFILGGSSASFEHIQQLLRILLQTSIQVEDDDRESHQVLKEIGGKVQEFTKKEVMQLIWDKLSPQEQQLLQRYIQ